MNLTRILTILAVFHCQVLFLSELSLALTQEWKIEHLEGESHLDDVWDVAAGPDEQACFAGTRYVYQGSGRNNILVACYDKDGNLLWEDVYDGLAEKSDQGQEIAIDSQGNVYAAGTTAVGGRKKSVLWLRKYSADGTVSWTATFGTTKTFLVPYGLAVGEDGSVYVTGSSQSRKVDNSDLFLFKFTSQGQIAWRRTDRSAYYGHGVSINSRGNLVVAGSAVVGGRTSLFLAEYSATIGKRKWRKTHRCGQWQTCTAYDVALDGRNNIYVTGNAANVSANQSDIWVGRYNARGRYKWGKSIDGKSGGSDHGYGIDLDSDGMIYVTGQYNVRIRGTRTNPWIGVFSPKGKKRGFFRGNSKVEQSFSVAVTPNDSIFLVSSRVYRGSQPWLTTSNVVLRKFER